MICPKWKKVNQKIKKIFQKLLTLYFKWSIMGGKKGGEPVFTVKQARVLKDTTQRGMAALLGVCVDTYREIERNPEQATVKQAKQICDYLGFTVEQIFFGASST